MTSKTHRLLIAAVWTLLAIGTILLAVLTVGRSYGRIDRETYVNCGFVLLAINSVLIVLRALANRYKPRPS